MMRIAAKPLGITAAVVAPLLLGVLLWAPWADDPGAPAPVSGPGQEVASGRDAGVVEAELRTALRALETAREERRDALRRAASAEARLQDERASWRTERERLEDQKRQAMLAAMEANRSVEAERTLREALDEMDAAIEERARAEAAAKEISEDLELMRSERDALESRVAALEEENRDLSTQLMNLEQALAEATVPATGESSSTEAVELAEVPESASASSTPSPSTTPAAPGLEIVVGREQLPPGPAALASDLDALHHDPGAQGTFEIDEALRRIARSRNAELVTRVPFDRGVARLYESVANGLLDDVLALEPWGDFLVAAYCDKSGSAEVNHRLSRARATSVAEAIARDPRRSGTIAVVDLGQTDRFDPDDLAKNRVVEIWRLR